MAKISMIDPSQFKLNIMAVDVEGFTKGTFMTITRSDPAFTQRRSLKGNTQVRKNSLPSYSFKFNLMQGVSANNWLHALFKLQEAYGVSFPIPLLFRDKLGTTTFFCKAVYIQEPNMALGNEEASVEWELICNSVSFTIGGNDMDSKLPKILSQISTAVGVMGAIGMNVGGFMEAAASKITNFIRF